MTTVSFKVPREMKEKMKETQINWSEELRGFVARRISEIWKEKSLTEIDSMLEEIFLKKTQKGTASKIVREDRDRH